MCKDAALTYLNELGYNVVRFPRADLSPLDVLGRQAGTLTRLGRLQDLVLPGGLPPPLVRTGVRAADLEARRSSRLGAEAAVTVLGPYLKALGGDAKASASFRRVKSLELVFTDVLIDLAAPADMGSYLGRSLLDAANLIWQPYLAGEGELFVVTETLKSRRLTIDAQAGHEAGVALDMGALQAALGGRVGVSASGGATGGSVISFTGSEPLVFGFRCVQLRIEGGRLALVNAAPSAALAFSAAAASEDEGAGDGAAHVLLGEGMLRLGRARRRAMQPPPATASAAPLPEEDSPAAAGEDAEGMLLVRLCDSALAPRPAAEVGVRGPKEATAKEPPAIDRCLSSDAEGVVLLDGCPHGVYEVACAGLRFEVHTLRASDLLADDEPARLIVAQAE